MKVETFDNPIGTTIAGYDDRFSDTMLVLTQLAALVSFVGLLTWYLSQSAIAHTAVPLPVHSEQGLGAIGLGLLIYLVAGR